MKRLIMSFRCLRNLSFALSCFMSFMLASLVAAQSVPYARSYAKSREVVDQALKEQKAYSGQKGPIVDVFVAA